MMRKLMPWAVMAVLVSYLALPVVAAQERIRRSPAEDPPWPWQQAS